MIAASSRLQVGQMLPDVSLSAAGGGASIPLRSDSGETTVLLWLHSDECDHCTSHLRSLGDISDEFLVWEARLLVVGSRGGSSMASSFAVMVEDERLPLPGAGVMVADRYGQIFYYREAGDGHAFPSTREMTEWLKHLGTLCPE